MSRRRWILGTAGLTFLALLLYLGFWPVPRDLPSGEAQHEHEHGGECSPQAGAEVEQARTHLVEPQDSIQAAITDANPGDTILVSAGVYHEALLIQVENLTLRGAVDDGERPVLDGRNQFENGVVACGDQFTMEGFDVRNYTENGVLLQDVNGSELRDITADHTGEYGLFSLASSGVLIEQSVAIGTSDAGIYVGQSEDVIVQENEVFANVAGIEIENSDNVLVQDNYAHDNTAGIFVFVLPDLDKKEGRNTLVERNRVIDNNLANFASEGEIVANLPSGFGIMIMAADNTEVRLNEIRGNNSAGIAVISLRQVFPDREVFDVGIESEESWVHDNSYAENGSDPDPIVTEAGLPGADLLWDVSGWNNSWSEESATRFPPLLPGPNWPDFARRAYWRILVLLSGFF